MRFGSQVIYAGVSLLAMSGFSAPAWAQENPAPDAQAAADATGELAPSNEIIVSARRREESVQDVPQTVNVVTAAQVEKLNLRSFQEISSVVPGLTLTQTSSFSSQASVRGIAFVPEASGNNPSVEFYLNDAPISSGFLFQSTYDFGQFELQRGPQGTLRGRAAPSGSIAVTVHRPDLNEVGAVINGTITDLSARKVDGALNIPIISDVLAIRLAGVVDNNRGNRVHSIKEISDPANNEGPYRRAKSIRGQIRFEPTDWAAFNVMYQALHAEDHSFVQVASNSLFVPGAPASAVVIDPFDRLSNEDQGTYGVQDHDVLIGNADISFAGQRLSYVGSYNKQEFFSAATADPGDFFTPPTFPTVLRGATDAPGFEPVCANNRAASSVIFTTGDFGQCTHGRAIRHSHELRLASVERIGGIFDYVIGGFYDRNNNPTNLTSVTALANTTTGTVGISPAAVVRTGHSLEKSAFGNLTAHLIDDRLELSGGLRYIDFKQDSKLAVASAPAFALTTQGTPTKDHLNATIYTGSVKFKVSDDIMVYALTGSSYRPGPRVVGDFSIGANGTSGPTARELQFLNLPPERSKSYEIGAKTSFLDGRGRFNIAAYRQTFRNYPFREPAVFYINYSLGRAGITGAPTGFNFVAPVPVTVKGVETEASFQILPRWSLGINAAYADGKIKNGTIACTDLNGDGIPDANVGTPSLAVLQGAVGAGQTVSVCSGINRRSNTTPKFSANAQSEFGFDVGDNMDGFVRALYNFSGRTINDPDNSFDNVGSYGLLNLYTGVRGPDGAWEITLFAKNLLREREILNVGSGALATTYRNNIGVTQAPFVSAYRSVSVTAPREFGVTARIALGSH